MGGICRRHYSNPMASSRGQADWESSTLPEGPLVVKDLAMEFVGQYNEPLVEWDDVSVVELSST